MATDRLLYLAIDELARRYSESMPPPRGGDALTRFELRCFSQHGEDGVLAEILIRVGITNRCFVEFGVESGREGNCVFLADVMDWSGTFIEADDDLYALLEHKYESNARVSTRKAKVTPDNIEAIFEAAQLPSEPDVMSIDIDGSDYWVWEAIQRYRSRVVVIEYNAALAIGRALVQPPDYADAWDGTDYFGASLDALRDLAAAKDYQLVHTELAGTNAFFVRGDLIGSAFPPASEVPLRAPPNYFMQGHRHPPHGSGRLYLDVREGELVPGDSTVVSRQATSVSHGDPLCILDAMDESSGALSHVTEHSPNEQAGGATLTDARVRAAIEGSAPSTALTAPAAGAPVSSSLVGGLDRMRSNANLHGFAITAAHGLLGMRTVKRVLRRLLYQVFDRQSDFNAATTGLLEQLVTDEHGARRGVDAQADALANTESRIGSFEHRLAELQAENTTLRERLDQHQIARTTASVPADAEIPPLDYLSLQARFRGTEDEITERQRRYVECFAGQQDVLDIGCGRGEFLRLLRDAGIVGKGVDTDLDMVKLCHVHGLDVSHGDALAYLSSSEDGALGGIFAAQVIEHLPPAQIVQLVQLARRKLRPGGVLVLETVNPGSFVALANFYLDFTHVKPVHPLALEWLAAGFDFVDTELLYLSPVEGGPRLHALPEGITSVEAAKPFDEAIAAANEVLYGPRDYALIARRP